MRRVVASASADYGDKFLFREIVRDSNESVFSGGKNIFSMLKKAINHNYYYQRFMFEIFIKNKQNRINWNFKD